MNCINIVNLNKNVDFIKLKKDYFMKVYPYINVDSKLPDESRITMRYKKISNYLKTEELEYTIKNKKYENIPDIEIIEELARKYNLLHSEIKKLVEKCEVPKNRLDIQNPGIQTILQNSKVDKKECKLFVNGVKSIKEINRINYFIL